MNVNELRASGVLSVAAPGLKCQGNTPYSASSFRCEGGDGRAADAVHTWEGRHYCGAHSPFDRWDVLWNPVTRTYDPIDAEAVLPDYVAVHTQGMTSDVVVGGVVVMSLPPRVWLRERPRAVAMIRRELQACGVTL